MIPGSLGRESYTDYKGAWLPRKDRWEEHLGFTLEGTKDLVKKDIVGNHLHHSFFRTAGKGESWPLQY